MNQEALKNLAGCSLLLCFLSLWGILIILAIVFYLGPNQTNDTRCVWGLAVFCTLYFTSGIITCITSITASKLKVDSNK